MKKVILKNPNKVSKKTKQQQQNYQPNKKKKTP